MAGARPSKQGGTANDERLEDTISVPDHPARADEPVRPGVVYMWEYPEKMELTKIITGFLGDNAPTRALCAHSDGKPFDMFMNETAGLKELPRNERATTIYRAAYMARHPTHDPESLAAIFGDV
jgi:hypothetical protein